MQGTHVRYACNCLRNHQIILKSAKFRNHGVKIFCELLLFLCIKGKRQEFGNLKQLATENQPPSLVGEKVELKIEC